MVAFLMAILLHVMVSSGLVSSVADRNCEFEKPSISDNWLKSLLMGISMAANHTLGSNSETIGGHLNGRTIGVTVLTQSADGWRRLDPLV